VGTFKLFSSLDKAIQTKFENWDFKCVERTSYYSVQVQRSAGVFFIEEAKKPEVYSLHQDVVFHVFKEVVEKFIK